MEYRVRVIGVRSEEIKFFYISNSMPYWLTVNHGAAAVYHNPKSAGCSAECAIDQGIESIKQELEFYHCELKEIQIVEEITTENVIQIFKPSDI